MRYFLHLAYNGTNYCGWQIQPHSPSVQETINTVLSKLLGEKIDITGAGRTDSGVHASCYYAHFDSEKNISLKDLKYKLNRMLPNDIVIYSVFPVSDSLHARFSAVSRTYTYTITTIKNPFAIETEYYFPTELNIDSMNKAAEQLIGEQDFTSFSKLHTDVNNNICTVTKAEWVSVDNKLIFTISANRFLRNMVRSIVGTLIDVGKGKTSIEDFSKILASKNRQNAGQSIPACGLSLCNIEYPQI
ncbi:MAG: tRNA pseudouridine(38-40) synthase TruA [Bacteroidales bacterium]|nr:tRNA pseudouridine(38-40) synthase TruA [Bacteroidales bacterium]